MIMLRDFVLKIQSRFFVDSDEVAAYRTVIPQYVNFSYKKDNKYYIGYIEDIAGSKIEGLLITQATTPDGLITNLNQLVYSHIKMPEKIRPYYGNMFQPRNGLNFNKAGEIKLVKA